VIDLNIKLDRNKHYTNYANVFSRLLLLKQDLLYTDSFLLVVENEKVLSLYEKVAKYLKIEFYSLSNLSDIIDFTYNKS
jgi:hypothetical protein